MEVAESSTAPTTGSKTAKRPLLELLQRVSKIISSKQNTFLKNSEINEILKEEFDIDVTKCHVLECNIYVHIIKNFLKMWPQWKSFDRMITNLRNKKDNNAIHKLVEEKYINLKEYLKSMLDIAAPMAKEKIQYVEQAAKAIKEAQRVDTTRPNDVILQIDCSHSQLSSLFYNHPVMNPANTQPTVFNVNKEIPSKISLNSVNYNAFLNWFNITITVNLPMLAYRRETIHQLSHTLVNKRLYHKPKDEELDQRLQKKTTATAQVVTSNLLMQLANIKTSVRRTQLNLFMELVCELIRLDLKNAPTAINLPGMYRRYMSKYPYVRYLYKDAGNKSIPDDVEKYDLQIEEVIQPMYSFHLTKYIPMGILCLTPEELQKNTIHCNTCNITFPGEDIYSFYQHMIDQHMYENDWQCTKCSKTFQMPVLADSRWYHNCESTS